MTKYTSKEALNIVMTIAMQCKLGNKTYEQGKIEAQPFFDIINEHIKVVAKKYGKKPYKMKWEGMTR